MDVAVRSKLTEQLDQPHFKEHICVIDAPWVLLERVRSVGNAIEHGARPDFLHHRPGALGDQKIHRDHVRARHVFQPPRRVGECRTVCIVPNLENKLEQVSADEPACAEDQDRTPKQ